MKVRHHLCPSACRIRYIEEDTCRVAIPEIVLVLSYKTWYALTWLISDLGNMCGICVVIPLQKCVTQIDQVFML